MCYTPIAQNAGPCLLCRLLTANTNKTRNGVLCQNYAILRSVAFSCSLSAPIVYSTFPRLSMDF